MSVGLYLIGKKNTQGIAAAADIISDRYIADGRTIHQNGQLTGKRVEEDRGQLAFRPVHPGQRTNRLGVKECSVPRLDPGPLGIQVPGELVRGDCDRLRHPLKIDGNRELRQPLQQFLLGQALGQDGKGGGVLPQYRGLGVNHLFRSGGNRLGDQPAALRLPDQQAGDLAGVQVLNLELAPGLHLKQAGFPSVPYEDQRVRAASEGKAAALGDPDTVAVHIQGGGGPEGEKLGVRRGYRQVLGQPDEGGASPCGEQLLRGGYLGPYVGEGVLLRLNGRSGVFHGQRPRCERGEGQQQGQRQRNDFFHNNAPFQR